MVVNQSTLRAAVATKGQSGSTSSAGSTGVAALGPQADRLCDHALHKGHLATLQQWHGPPGASVAACVR
jgi:hypothetical protein